MAANVHGSGSPVEVLPENSSDIAPGAITIYNTDQTVLYPDIFEGIGTDQNGGVQDNMVNGSEEYAAGQGVSGDENIGNENTGNENIENLNTGAENSGEQNNNGIAADIWGNGTSDEDQLTQDQITILNQMPEALP